jgi:hypothetical protein
LLVRPQVDGPSLRRPPVFAEIQLVGPALESRHFPGSLERWRETASLRRALEHLASARESR